MRYLIVLGAFIISSFVSCKKSSNSSNAYNLEKIDSIASIATSIGYGTCNPLQAQNFRHLALLKFFYDSTGNIVKMNRSIESSIITLYAEYFFYYDNSNRIIKIISKCKDPQTYIYDSIRVVYVSSSELRVEQYIPNKANPSFDIVNVFNFIEENSKMKVSFNSGYNTSSVERIFEGELYKNSDNVNSSLYMNYFYSKKDTISNLSCQYSQFMNPYFSIYKKLGFPFFFIISKGGLSSGLNFVDLAQEISANTILSLSNQKVYPFCNGFSTYNIESLNVSFVNSLIFDNKSRIINIKNIDNIDRSRTLSGIINSNSFFSYY